MYARYSESYIPKQFQAPVRCIQDARCFHFSKHLVTAVVA